ncbi:N-formylglutamate amidohydrolase [Beijerinckiaceae bacterium RH AL1]|nr:N-formylglutamate amidohydrolase [Beijerinckiaceae bacterium]VVB44706.1 N-formylglutamate amidohydrolase [Beijerinckiaceae bacterium RH CH11]VVB44784.1 N-formylglutamate amidohydrolase [Beijerinckiaceae bacterium RH AL8]VVC54494.1 N-formylglutamate amidohydrolase [Beijerinckiaceae bacterium RH AL1]
MTRPDDFPPVEAIDGDEGGGLLFICDHASNALPPRYGTLGLPEAQLQRHIGYDIGAADVTRHLARRFNAPAVLTTFSRLLIDPNRGEDDPTLVMRLSDGAIVPGNARIDEAEIAHRRETYWRPYRLAVGAVIERMSRDGRTPVVVSIHSFTQAWKGVPRPWEIGILWDTDPRLAKPLMAGLRNAGFFVGDNEPYDGALKGDTLDEEVTRRGIAGLLVEFRQDLVASAETAVAIAERFAEVLAPVVAQPVLHEPAFIRSRTGRHIGEESREA